MTDPNYKLTDVLLVPNSEDPSTWDIRIMTVKWGTVGARHLRGEMKFPADYSGLSLDDAIEAREKWQQFMDAGDNRLKRSARRKR